MKKVLIIGSGISGLATAIEAASLGMKVVLAQSAVSERSQSVMAAGGINGATLEDDSYLLHAEDTIKGGCYIENEEDIKAFCKSAPDILDWLESLGMVFSRGADGKRLVRAFGGQSKNRTAFAGTSTGKQIVTALVRKAREYEIQGLIERIADCFFESALISEGKCYGAVLCNIFTGEIKPIFASSVIMATGGQNSVFGKTTGSTLCDGYAVGKLFEQGANLKNLEFIQYHPTTIETEHKKMLITEAVRGEGGRLFYYENSDKVYFMETAFGKNGNLMPRDIVSRCIYNTKKQVYLDITFLGREKILERLPEVYEMCMTYAGLDITKTPIPVSPSVHFFMGGLFVNSNHMTNIKNLYAVGECASKYHGANRLGGNSTLAAIYSGKVAANDAFKQSEEMQDESRFTDYIGSVKAKIDEIMNSESSFPKTYLKNMLSETMNTSLGIVRDKDALEEGIKAIDFIKDAESKIKCDKSLSLYENIRLSSMITLSKTILMSALNREESRGAHARSDFPESDGKYGKVSVATYDNGEIKIEYRSEANGL